jgi:hypothetical protein
MQGRGSSINIQYNVKITKPGFHDAPIPRQRMRSSPSGIPYISPLSENARKEHQGGADRASFRPISYREQRATTALALEDSPATEARLPEAGEASGSSPSPPRRGRAHLKDPSRTRPSNPSMSRSRVRLIIAVLLHRRLSLGTGHAGRRECTHHRHQEEHLFAPRHHKSRALHSPSKQSFLGCVC